MTPEPPAAASSAQGRWQKRRPLVPPLPEDEKEEEPAPHSPEPSKVPPEQPKADESQAEGTPEQACDREHNGLGEEQQAGEQQEENEQQREERNREQEMKALFDDYNSDPFMIIY